MGFISANLVESIEMKRSGDEDMIVVSVVGKLRNAEYGAGFFALNDRYR
jgi:hypothetical protein